jgi:hypothetical protein
MTYIQVFFTSLVYSYLYSAITLLIDDANGRLFIVLALSVMGILLFIECLHYFGQRVFFLFQLDLIGLYFDFDDDVVSHGVGVGFGLRI